MWNLIEVVQALSLARDLPTVQRIVRRAARQLTGADGATFVLRDDGKCFYADEDAIAPLWKGQRFPLEACISGWAMLNRQAAVIPDIYADARIPHDAYRPTFVKSLAMVPIRRSEPIGAIGNYWASHHEPTGDEVALLQALADSTAIAMEHVAVLGELEERVALRTEQLARRTAEAEALTEEVRRLSVTDWLTGVLNRRGFLEQVEDARWGPDGDGPAQLLFADLDGLKGINDTYGHEEGDAVISSAAQLIRTVLGPGALVGRWGGDELVAFLPGTDDPAPAIARLQAAITDRNAQTGHGAPVAMSIGATRVEPGDPQPIEQILAAADTAMYEAKRSGRMAARVRP